MDILVCVTHDAIPGAGIACHVKALMQWVIHIQTHTNNHIALLCAYLDKIERGNITEGLIRVMLKFSTNLLNYPARGIPLGRINTHSLSSGGYVPLHRHDTLTGPSRRWTTGCPTHSYSRSIYNNNNTNSPLSPKGCLLR